MMPSFVALSGRVCGRIAPTPAPVIPGRRGAHGSRWVCTLPPDHPGPHEAGDEEHEETLGSWGRIYWTWL